jgi:hypothetical protein
MTGVADYLSLWCTLYGLREWNIRVSSVSWYNAHTLVFRILDADARPISPMRYDPRLPEVSYAFLARAERIRRFVGMSPWYRGVLHDVDRALDKYLRRWDLKAEDVELVNRWTNTGFIVLAVVWKSTPATRRRYQTHLKFTDAQA